MKAYRILLVTFRLYLLATFKSYLAIAAETSGETCGWEQFQGTEGESLLQRKQSSSASLQARKDRDSPMEYPILAAGVDDPRAYLPQAGQSPGSAVSTVEPMDVEYDTKGELVDVSIAKTGQTDSELQPGKSYSHDHNLDQKRTSSEEALTKSKNNSSTPNEMANNVLVETGMPALSAEIVFAVSSMMTMMISTLLIRTESAMALPPKINRNGG